MRGSVDVTAAAGDTGTLLLDPATLTIVDEAAGGDHDAALPAIAAADADIGGNTLSWGAIDALAATAHVVLEASGLVTIADVTGNAGGTITAPDLVQLDLTTGSLTITSTTGSVVFEDVNDVIRTEGGAITINAASSATLGGFDTTGAGGGESGAVSLNIGSGSFGSIATGGGVFTVDSAGTVTQAAATIIAGATALPRLALTLRRPGNDYTGTTTVSAGTLRAGADTGLSAVSSVSLDSAATLDVDGHSITVAALSGTAGATLALGAGGDVAATGNLDLSGIDGTFAGDGDNVLDAGATLTTSAALAKTDAGNLTLGAATAIVLGGDVSVSSGDLTLADDFTLSSGDLSASGSIAFAGAGTSTFTAAAVQSVTATNGSITDSAGAAVKGTAEPVRTQAPTSCRCEQPTRRCRHPAAARSNSARPAATSSSNRRTRSWSARWRRARAPIPSISARPARRASN